MQIKQGNVKIVLNLFPFNLHPDFSRVPPYPDFSRLLSDFFRVASAQFFGGWQLEKKSSEYLEKSGRDGTL